MPKEREKEREIPLHEDDRRNDDGAGVTVDLDELPEADGKKKSTEERGARRTEERAAEAEDDQEGALDVHAEDVNDELRKQRKEERQQRKAERARREAALNSRVESVERENAELRTAVAQSTQQDVRERVGRIDADLETARRQYNEAKSLKEQAYNAQKGKEAVEADEAMNAARDRFQSLSFERDNIITKANEQAAESRRPKMSKVLSDNARAFIAENKEWYDPQGSNRDSAKVLAIDRKMAGEGWDPNTAGYWEELRVRVREDLPHRFDGDDADDTDREREERRPAPRQRTAGSGREGGGGGGNSFYLSAARVAALKEAGMWEDPAKRAKMIRTYKERDEKEKRVQQQRAR